MIARGIRILQFLRVADESGNLSLTNLALAATLIRLLMQPELAIADIATFVATILGYQFKRYMAPEPQAAASEIEDVKKALEAMQSKLSAMQIGRALNK
jgi:hypothetical protein